MLVFQGCQTLSSQEDEGKAEARLQEALYFRSWGLEDIAKRKAEEALALASQATTKVAATCFLEGHSKELANLDEGDLKWSLQGDEAYARELFEEALALYEKAFSSLEKRLSELYEQRGLIDAKTLGIYQQRLSMRLVQLKMAFCLALLGRDEEADLQIERVLLHKSLVRVREKLRFLESKGCDLTLAKNEDNGYSFAQFASLTEAKERYLLDKSLSFLERKRSLQ